MLLSVKNEFHVRGKRTSLLCVLFTTLTENAGLIVPKLCKHSTLTYKKFPKTRCFIQKLFLELTKSNMKIEPSQFACNFQQARTS